MKVEIAPALSVVPPEPLHATFEPLQHGVAVAVDLPDRAMTCEEAEAMLVGPLRETVGEPYDLSHLLEGLRDYTYINNAFAKNAKGMGHETRVSLRQMVPDIRRLGRMLESQAGRAEVVRPVRIANWLTAPVYARDHLLDMKPSQIVRLCQDLDMEFNELALWKLKGGDRHNKDIAMYHLEDLGIDSERLRAELVERLFTQISVLDEAGIDVVLAHNEDVSSPGWLPDAALIERKRDLGMVGDLQHWELSFRKGATTRLRIVPVIGWAAVGELHRGRRIKPDYRASRMHFDETTNCLTHFSPVLGAVELSGGIKLPPDLERLAGLFFGRKRKNGRPDYSHHRGQRLPRTAIAALPAILTRSDLSQELPATNTFRIVEAQVIPGAKGMISKGNIRHRSSFYDSNGRARVANKES